MKAPVPRRWNVRNSLFGIQLMSARVFMELNVPRGTVCYPLKDTFAVIKSLTQKLGAYVHTRTSFDAGRTQSGTGRFGARSSQRGGRESRVCGEQACSGLSPTDRGACAGRAIRFPARADDRSRNVRASDRLRHRK